MTEPASRARRSSLIASVPPLEGPTWGLRATPNLLKGLLSGLHGGPATKVELTAILAGKRPAAELALVSAKRLGLITRHTGRYSLTPRGKHLVYALGTPLEKGRFRETLLAFAPFRQAWEALAGRYREVGRAETIAYAKARYHYSDQTADAVGSLIIAYAQSAGLCRKLGDSPRYEVLERHPRVPSESEGGDRRSSADSGSVSAGSRGAASNPEGRVMTHLYELLARLAFPVASDQALRDEEVKEGIARAFDEAIHSANDGGWETLLRLAKDLAGRSFESVDREPARLAVICLRGIQEALEARGVAR